MTDQAPETTGAKDALQSLVDELPTDQLKKEVQNFLSALAQAAIGAAAGKVGHATSKLTNFAENGGTGTSVARAGASALGGGKPLRGLVKAGVSGVAGMVTNSLRDGGGGGGGKGLKVTNIVEDIDIGVPRKLVYDVWTQFQDFPSFMKKVETVSQEEDEKLTWKAQVLWSHRQWQSTITEQIPDQRIVWQSQGEKGHVDGAVTFHELAPELTRVLVALEYHPGGVIESTGNLWRAQGRRVRLELKHFRRHVMTQVILHPDEIEGWRGEIRDGEVVRADGESGDRDEARDRAGAGQEREEREDSGREDYDEYEDSGRDDDEDQRDEDGWDEDDRDEYADDYDYDDEDAGGDEDTDDYDDEDATGGEDEDEDEEENDDSRPSRRRRRATAGSR
ncbi:MAG TPA: SRPBCC family protein [Streptosporangiaceae bacterium]|nr:SRPBCC family protein [Streptosporangiaceae bacterium]